ncbi:hypothetical protein V7112_19675, partial [Bacillus sp. JJ1566]|uniref:hypothetical protein n=1 Tax=Bacillus sp. JJ1566 TaxID=3122961 RepID=UPI002FFF733A
FIHRLLVEAHRMWVTKTLPHDVAFLVFVHFIRILLAIALCDGLVAVNAEKFPLKNRAIRRRL